MKQEELNKNHSNIPPAESWYISDDVVPIYANHLFWCMEVGLVARCREIANALSRQQFLKLDEVASAVQSARSWLAEAEQYEEEHGTGSKINQEHPSLAKARARLLNVENNN